VLCAVPRTVNGQHPLEINFDQVKKVLTRFEYGDASTR
jgi:hypothetical protein